MPSLNSNNLAVILDNLNDFSNKLLAQIANDSPEGRQQLLYAIERANANYNLPIETHITGWFYYFSRTRGPMVKKALEHIELEANPVNRLELFKGLLVEGQWNVGSFNYHLFIELINGVPGYEPLDAEAAAPVIKRLDVLLLKKIDHFIKEFQASQRLIAEREKSRLELQKAQECLFDNIALAGSALSAQHAAKAPYKKVSFLLVKEGQWTLSWVNGHGMSFPLTLNQELERFLNEQNIETIEKVNELAAKRIKKECLKIRDAFFEKTQVLINPKHLKTGAELDNEQLRGQGRTNTFVLRAKEGRFSLAWINVLGKALAIDLNANPDLAEFLAGQEDFSTEDLVQLKAYLTQVKTTQVLEMDEFKIKLQNCLLNRTAKKEDKAPEVKRLDLSHFKDIERCLGQRFEQTQSDETETGPVKEPVKKLSFSKYSAVATLFAHRPAQTESAQWLDKAEPLVIENHL